MTEHLRVLVSWLMEIKLKGLPGTYKTEFKDKDEVGVVWPIPLIAVLVPLARITVGKVSK